MHGRFTCTNSSVFILLDASCSPSPPLAPISASTSSRKMVDGAWYLAEAGEVCGGVERCGKVWKGVGRCMSPPLAPISASNSSRKMVDGAWYLEEAGEVCGGVWGCGKVWGGACSCAYYIVPREVEQQPD